MNDAAFSYAIATSLVTYVGGIVLFTSLLERLADDACLACRMWTGCFSMLLLVPIAVMTIPSLRLGFPQAGSSLPFLANRNGIAVVLLNVWGLGAVVVAIFHLRCRCRLGRWIRATCEDLTSDEVVKLKQIVPEIPTAVRFVTTDLPMGPWCHGQAQRTIVLPRYLLSESDQVVRHAVLHELAHLQHKHPQQLLLQNACTTLYWFHPFVFWAARRATLAREFLCDEVVVLSEGSVSSYLRSLVVVAERTNEGDRSGNDLNFARRSSLRRRSDRLVRLAGRNSETRTHWRKRAALMLLAALVLVICGWLAWTLATTPETTTMNNGTS